MGKCKSRRLMGQIIARRLELYQASESNTERLAQLGEWQTMVADTSRGLRRIIRDLRPLVLEDLGPIPVLRMPLRASREGMAPRRTPGSRRPASPSTWALRSLSE